MFILGVMNIEEEKNTSKALVHKVPFGSILQFHESRLWIRQQKNCSTGEGETIIENSWIRFVRVVFPSFTNTNSVVSGFIALLPMTLCTRKFVLCVCFEILVHVI